jgi:molecular chaperone DnaK (HSP70)
MDLGIDLGTTNSAVAGYTASGLRIFKTAEGTISAAAPSISRSCRR